MNGAPASISCRQPWAQSLRGNAIDLLHPRPDQIDFREMADVLAQAVRYAGNSVQTVSIGHHSLIVLKAARQRRASSTLQAMALLHDGHEWVLGDWTTPASQAIGAVAEEVYGPTARHIHAGALEELKHRHDRAIHAAAGLPMPTAEQRAIITECDLVALNTERRDFLAPCERQWTVDAKAFPPLHRREPWMPPAEVAAQLSRAFRNLLPALRDGTAR